jgi:nitroreductase
MSVVANPVFEAVRTVLAVREFDDRPIPEDTLGRIVESAHLTASASNLQPWQFVVVRDRSRLEELGRLVRTGPYTAGAAAAVIAAHERGSRTGMSDVSRAIQSMIVTAWAEGVGSNWTGFAGLDGVREAFGIPDGYEVVGVIPLGYPKRKLGLGKKKRKPIGDVVSDGRFGTPWEG